MNALPLFEDSGWKYLQSDVFRPARHPLLLSALVGTGVQTLGMTAATLLCTVFGLHHPEARGAVLSTLLLVFVAMGVVGGYASARVYKFQLGVNYYRNTLATALLYPGSMAALFCLINVIIAWHGSSVVTPLPTLVWLLLLWACVSTPLVFLGAYFGYSAPVIDTTTTPNPALHPRPVPPQPWYTNPWLSAALGGVLPFGAVCIELFCILSAVWNHQAYFVFGFLFLVFLILCATCAEITIVLCYVHLCTEDYRWGWRAFLTSGSTAAYLFLYSLWYYCCNSDITGLAAAVVFFAYMGMASLTFFVLTGCIGYLACLWFLRTIYASIKMD